MREKQQTPPPTVPAIEPKQYHTIKVLTPTWLNLQAISQLTGQTILDIIGILADEELKRQRAAHQK